MSNVIIQRSELLPDFTCPKCGVGFEIEILDDFGVEGEYKHECEECKFKIKIRINGLSNITGKNHIDFDMIS